MFMLMNVYLSDFVRQDALHGSLNGRASNASARGGALNIVVVRHRIVPSNNYKVWPTCQSASEKPDPFIGEWMGSAQILPCQRQNSLWKSKC